MRSSTKYYYNNSFGADVSNLKELAYTKNDFKQDYSNIKDLRDKFYSITMLINIVKSIIDCKYPDRVKSFIAIKNIKHIIKGLKNTGIYKAKLNNVAEYQMTFRSYLRDQYLPFLMKEYDNLTEELQSLREHKTFSKPLPENRLL